VEATSVSVVGNLHPTDVFGPAAEVATRWLDVLRSRQGTTSLAWSDAVRLTNQLLEHLDARVGGGDPGGLTGVLDGPLPDVDDIVALRAVFRGQAASHRSPDSALPFLHHADETVDELLTILVRAKVDALESAAFIDPLTGTGNRRALERDVARELARSFRHSRPVSIAAIDIDGLKKVNDTRGHAAGDEVLRDLANTLGETLRVGDGIYRVGGDEFVVLLPETVADDVRVLLDRAAVNAPSFSFGVACAPDDATNAEALLAYADAQLIEGRRLRRGSGAATIEDEVIDLTDSGPFGPAAVAELVTATPAASPAAAPRGRPERIAIGELLVGSGERAFTAEITMHAGTAEIVGRSTGSCAGAAGKRIVAEAVLDAASHLDPDLATSFIDGINVFRVADADAVAVNIVMVGDAECVVIGVAQIRDRGPFDAVARATMNALNRRLAMVKGAGPGTAGA
jgi:diguanylate cyclase (GGDEF)-like protein